MTPQDIREKVLEKTVIGGYDIAAVDQFREEAAVALADGQKEVAVLKGKMKVLVDKIEDYRSTEDAMRLALVQAQKVAKQITEDAKTQAAQTIADEPRRQEADERPAHVNAHEQGDAERERVQSMRIREEARPRIERAVRAEHEQHHAACHQQLVERRSVCSLRYGHLVAQAIEVRVANVSGFGLRGFSVGTVFVVSGVFVSHLNHLLSASRAINPICPRAAPREVHRSGTFKPREGHAFGRTSPHLAHAIGKPYPQSRYKAW